MLDSANLLGCSESHVLEYGPGILLHPDVFEPLAALQLVAREQGFGLQVASAYRSFDRQLAIWNMKARGERSVLDGNGQVLDLSAMSERERVWAILRWSALPGASRHHWGTDFDIYDSIALDDGEALQLTLEETQQGGPFYDMYEWLNGYLATDNSLFFRPYLNDLGGVAVEPWHLSYRPLSEVFASSQKREAIKSLLLSAGFELKDAVMIDFDEIYERFVVNVCPPV